MHGSEIMQKTEPIVKCFGVPDEKTRNLTRDKVEIFQPETKTWKEYQIVHSFENCPVCGKPMHVLAIKGSTWLACCSKECTDKFAEKERDLGGMSEAFAYFRKERGIQ